MAVDTKLNAPAGQRVDTELSGAVSDNMSERELVAAPRGSVDVSKHLVHMVERSAQSLRHAAESMENRGLKLLLKVLAQERAHMHNALRQASGYRAVDALDPSEKSSGASLREGLQELQSSMAVQQQGRQHVALNYLLDEEEKLVEAYTNAITSEDDPATRELLTVQRDHISAFVARLRGVDFVLEPIIARVFDTRVEGESAAMRLQSQGLDAAQIDVLPISHVDNAARDGADYRGGNFSTETKVSPKTSPQQTMMAGALVGGLCGGIFGLALALFVWMAPQLIGWVTVGPWQLLIGSILAGAVAGTVFGFFIGQNQKEIDVAVTADSLINGEILVAAYPMPNQIDLVEEVLQVRHARELNR